MASKVDIAKRIDQHLRQMYDKAFIDPTPENLQELNNLLANPNRVWYHSTPGYIEDQHNIKPEDYFENKSDEFKGFFHLGTKQAADDRAHEVGRVEPHARTIEANLNIDPNKVHWVYDQGLGHTSDYLLGDRSMDYSTGELFSMPLNRRGLITPDSDIYIDTDTPYGIRDLKHKDEYWRSQDPQVVADAEDEMRDLGIEALAYKNTSEDAGGISIVPIARNTVYNAKTGNRIKEMATPIAGGGLLAADSDAEAADFSTDYLHQLDEYVPEPKVGAVTQFIADMATDFAGWREQVNKDLRENPVAALASIPIGAIEEVWAGTNLALEGWTALDKFIDQNDDVRRVDQLLDKSYEYKDKFGDFFTEQGFPESWRTVGGITGVGGVATKGAKKGADVLYDLYRLGL